ncbi:hypothetical protein GWO43_06830 [candidate division KSB1 bacterium]|nr:hypothetical protein [candidate division KSB1 bacterium]NIR72650.1 hypothetical protein [candidate division KSB1 bacterium]NIS23680.1 hypothetical protein [candidate division KSB1 bacterium]NIT70600.1 hypothetical protein [candidate division KSB1 bacterium]NIU24328.1 hypothetical protein [candidate division KSB1 bacterium]
MRKIRVFCIASLLLLTSTALSQDRGFGAGIILGEPTGISLKSWLQPTKAFDVAVAWSFEGENSFTLHADYLNHNFGLIRVEKGRLPFYYGIGGRIKFEGDGAEGDDDPRVGVRVPLGLAYLVENVTLDLFVELAPILDLVPETEFRVHAAIGARYFF